MKILRRWMIPAFLSLFGAWIGIQFLFISRAENENEALRRMMAEDRKTTVPQPAADDGNAIDWKLLSGNPAVRSGDYEGTRLRLRLQRRFQGWTVEQLTGAMDEIIAADIPQSFKENFAWKILEVLIQKDPELALVRYADGFETSEGSPLYPLAVAIKGWARKDPTSARAWFDGQVAAGTFIGKELKEGSSSRWNFETQLLTALIDSDPAAAIRLVPELGRSEKARGLGDVAIEEVKAANFATVIRGTLDRPKDRALAFASAASPLATRRGYGSVTRFMEEIVATQEEREAIALRVVENKRFLTSEDIGEMRSWAGRWVPESVDSLTGNALSRTVPLEPGRAGMGFEEAAEIAVSYGSDRTIAAFLYSHAARNHRERAREIAETISDEELRNRTLQYLR